MDLSRLIPWLWCLITGLLLDVSVTQPGKADEKDFSRAEVRVCAARPGPHPIPREITGQFCEHLGTNIYHGMDAQILRNSTFADYPFWSGAMTPEGATVYLGEREAIARKLHKQATREGWPEDEIDRLVKDHEDGLACWWAREGPRSAVEVSADTGSHGGRAQRVQVSQAGQGIAQWIYLPLHRVRKYELEILTRSPDISSLSLALFAKGSSEPCARGKFEGIGRAWSTCRTSLAVDGNVPADAVFRLAVTANAPGQFVVARLWMRPADHIAGADPDVVRLLKQAKLPILRWPGGNFVSSYHWEDGIGPPDARPTRPNLAWGGVEPHTFGTDEFMAFCRAVGCEPMICVNAGSGTPEEAVRWIEYCNGPPDSPMGRRRSANGHPEPYRVRHWEIGNELWGRWQYRWTTAAGYVDRFHQFHKAMLAADPTITLHACGAPVLWGKAWNDTLLKGAAKPLTSITDHPLIGGSVPVDNDPMDVYRDFMVVPDVLAAKWGALQEDMKAAGIREPRLAVTELQLFPHLGPVTGAKPARLTHDNLVNPGTHAEALYDVLIYHRAIRLAPFVSMITHSATVNHGGGLRKQRERVFANPCYHAMAGFADLAGTRPLAVETTAPMETAPWILPDLQRIDAPHRHPLLDALATRADDGTLWLSLVQRGSSQAVKVAIRLEDFKAGPKAEMFQLSAKVPWAVNTREIPEAVQPIVSSVAIRDNQLSVDMPAFTWVRLRIPPDKFGEPRTK